MATGPIYIVRQKRRRSSSTDYRRRIKMLESRIPRLVVRLSNSAIRVQLTEYETKGDKAKASAISTELGKYGWTASGKNTSAAYLTGLLCGARAKKAGTKNAILDMGQKKATPGSKIYAALKGAIDAGLEIPSGAKYPDEARISSQHIAKYAAALKSADKEAYNEQFSGYLKSNIDPEKIPVMFNAAKVKILGESK